MSQQALFLRSLAALDVRMRCYKSAFIRKDPAFKLLSVFEGLVDSVMEVEFYVNVVSALLHVSPESSFHRSVENMTRRRDDVRSSSEGGMELLLEFYLFIA